MGMDVKGRKPCTPEGEYFRNNVWSWRPLATYVCAVGPDEIISKCRHWHTNDGDGLNATDSRKLADVLQAEIDSGRTEAYERRYRSAQAEMPDEQCDLCEGTGTRKPVPEHGAGDPKGDGIKCNKCNGHGYVEAWARHYPFRVTNVKDFVAFLRGCGGFKIF